MECKRLKGVRRGVVLVWALVTVAVTTTILGALGYYYTGAARIANFYMQQTAMRFTGQRTIDEQVVDPIGQAITALNDGGGVAKANAFEELAKKLKAALEDSGLKEVKSGGKVVAYQSQDGGLTIDSPDKLLEQSGDRRTLVIKKVVSSGGNSITLQQEVTFERVEAEGTIPTSHPIFNYVYFANNYGHLESAKIIANGDVGANADFWIKNAVVNGFISSAGSVYLTEAKIWPRATYMKQVSDEYIEQDGAGRTVSYCTQVRPTDPLIGGAYSLDWPGGYEPVSSTHAVYGDPSNPNAVSDPGTKKEFTKTEPNRYGSSYSWPNKPTSYTSRWTTYWQYVNYYNTTVKNFTSESRARAAYEEAYSDPPDQADCGYPREAYEYSKGKWRWGTNKTDYKTKEAAETARKNSNEYKTADNKYNNAVTLYNQFQAQKSKYEDDVDQYEKDKAAYAEYEEGYDNDKGDYDAYMLWLQNYTGGTYAAPLTASLVTERGNLIVSSRVDKVDMPDISDKQKYIDFCNSYVTTNTTLGYRLKCNNCYRANAGGTEQRLTVANCRVIHRNCRATGWKKNILGKKVASDVAEAGQWLSTEEETDASISPPARVLSKILIPASTGYVKDVAPFVTTGHAAYSAAEDFEKGSLILIGTLYDPIEIDGPVFVEGDVVIRGFVKGQGAIYAGRNIHIIGDISYLNAPNWPHATADLSNDQYTPDKVKANNACRDLLGLYARGNIIIGDYKSDLWTSDANMGYLRNSRDIGFSYGTSNDSDIGYSTSFNSNPDYTAADGGSKVSWEYSFYEKYYYGDTDLNHLSYFSSIRSTVYYYEDVDIKTAKVTEDRKYYESIFGSDTLTELKQSTASAGASQSTSFLKRLIQFVLGLFNLYHGETLPNETAPDPADISEIDAVLFANHGIFGVVGGTTSHKFALNGALLCRDEGVLQSFETRFGSYPDARVWLNWDMRIKSDSAEGNSIVGATADSSTTSAKSNFEVYISDWHQSQSAD